MDAIILRCLVQVVIHLLSCVGINPDLKEENFDEWSQFLLGFYNNVQLNQNEQPEWTRNNILTATALGKNLPRGLKEFVKHGVLSQKRRGLSIFSFMLIVLKNNLANWKAGNYTEKPFLGGSIWNSGAVDSTNILVGVGMKASKENVVKVRSLSRFRDLKPCQAEFNYSKAATTLVALFGIAVQTNKTDSQSLALARKYYNDYLQLVPYGERLLLLDIDLVEPKEAKPNTTPSGVTVKSPTTVNATMEEAKGDVTNLLEHLNKPEAEFSREAVANLTLELVKTLTGQTFTSTLEAQTNLGTTLKLRNKFRPNLFHRVINSIILDSGDALKSLEVQRTDVEFALTFGEVDLELTSFKDDKQQHLYKRIMLLIPAREFVVIKSGVLEKKTVDKNTQSWVKRLIEFLKTIETNDAWVSTLSNFTEDLDKVTTSQLVFIAQKQYMDEALGLKNYKSNADTIKAQLA